ncbi:hypothetical protein ACS0TY_009168 [Phlomoides rotata]
MKRRKRSSGKYNFLERLLGVTRLLSQMVEPLLKAAISGLRIISRFYFSLELLLLSFPIGVITPYEGQRAYIVNYMSRNGALLQQLYKEIELNYGNLCLWFKIVHHSLPGIAIAYSMFTGEAALHVHGPNI